MKNKMETGDYAFVLCGCETRLLQIITLLIMIIIIISRYGKF